MYIISIVCIYFLHIYIYMEIYIFFKHIYIYYIHIYIYIYSTCIWYPFSGMHSGYAKRQKKKAFTRFTENLLSGGIITDRSHPKSWRITKVPPVQWHSAAILQFKDLLLAGNLGNFTECFWCFWMGSDGLIWKWGVFTKQNCLFLTFSSDSCKHHLYKYLGHTSLV